MRNLYYTLFVAVLAVSCGGDSSTEDSSTVDLFSLIETGADESSIEYWDCSFLNRDTSETGSTTLTFWENGRGITGSGSLYDWTLDDSDLLRGTYDSAERVFVFEEFEFSNNDNTFTALDISTRNPGTDMEAILLFDVTCQRF